MRRIGSILLVVGLTTACGGEPAPPPVALNAGGFPVTANGSQQPQDIGSPARQLAEIMKSRYDAQRAQDIVDLMNDQEWVTAISNETLRASVLSLHGTLAEPVIPWFLEPSKLGGDTIRVVGFDDYSAVAFDPPPAQPAAVPPAAFVMDCGDVQTLAVDPGSLGLPVAAIGAIAFHEALHIDTPHPEVAAPNGAIEESLITYLEAVVWLQQIAAQPALAHNGADNDHIALLNSLVLDLANLKPSGGATSHPFNLIGAGGHLPQPSGFVAQYLDAYDREWWPSTVGAPAVALFASLELDADRWSTGLADQLAQVEVLDVAAEARAMLHAVFGAIEPALLLDPELVDPDLGGDVLLADTFPTTATYDFTIRNLSGVSLPWVQLHQVTYTGDYVRPITDVIGFDPPVRPGESIHVEAAVDFTGPGGIAIVADTPAGQASASVVGIADVVYDEIVGTPYEPEWPHATANECSTITTPG